MDAETRNWYLRRNAQARYRYAESRRQKTAAYMAYIAYYRAKYRPVDREPLPEWKKEIARRIDIRKRLRVSR